MQPLLNWCLKCKSLAFNTRRRLDKVRVFSKEVVWSVFAQIFIWIQSVIHVVICWKRYWLLLFSRTITFTHQHDTNLNQGGKKEFYNLNKRWYLIALVAHDDIFSKGCRKIYHHQSESYYRALVTGTTEMWLTESLQFAVFVECFFSFPSMSGHLHHIISFKWSSANQGWQPFFPTSLPTFTRHFWQAWNQMRQLGLSRHCHGLSTKTMMLWTWEMHPT